jgi:hypothetical protein
MLSLDLSAHGSGLESHLRSVSEEDMMCIRMLLRPLLVIGCLMVPNLATAQSAIAGVVRDSSGAVLPGVTIEVTSPALIEKTRTTVTDGSGQYRVVDLRPGTYSVSFTLTGFNGIKREGIILEANFTAPVNAELRVGAITETVVVTGDTPVVDVQSTMRRDVVTRDLLDTLPTGRDFQTIGNVVPSVTMGRFDVGGSSTAQSGTLIAFGSRGGDFHLNIDGKPANITFGEGWFNGIYHNESTVQEMSYTISGGNAETPQGGVSVNMIPRTGGNTFTYEGLGTWANNSLQANNYDDELRARGFNPTAGGLSKLWDLNGSVGGPIMRDRLWFFGSARYWGFSENVPNVFLGQSDPKIVPPNAVQASDDTTLKSGNFRLTTQIGNTRITGSYDNGPRTRQYFGIENRGGSPESFAQYPNSSYVNQYKSTTTLTPRMLLELGFTRVWWYSELVPQPQTRMATCFVAFTLCPSGTDYGDIRKTDLTQSWNFNAPGNPNSTFEAPRNTVVGSLSYVTGGHTMKVGITQGWGFQTVVTPMNNGGLTQRYRLNAAGVLGADSVTLAGVPSITDVGVNWDLGVYLQDSWTRGRLTLNPGVRLDHIKGEIRDQTAAAGRFLPERRFTQADYHKIPVFTDVNPRLGAAYDLFGNGKTALKASFGKYVQSFSSNLPADYNPMGGATDTRSWVDSNADGIAQESELGATTNLNFGKASNVTRPDADLKRPYQLLYNGGIQQELRPGLSASLSYYYRKFYRDFRIDNAATTFDDYTRLAIPDPRGNGQTIDLYSISLAKLGVSDNVRLNSTENGRTYHGIDLSFTARLKNGAQVQGGVNSGRLHEYACEVDDPNNLRFCDRAYSFDKQFKLSGTYPLPFKFRLSGLFQSVPGVQSSRDGGNVGRDVGITYSIGRAIAPALNQTTVSVRLNEPDSLYLDRVNQLDFALSRDFQFGKVRVRPQLDIFNALNNNAVTQVNNSFGQSLMLPVSVLNPRLARFNVRVTF